MVDNLLMLKFNREKIRKIIGPYNENCSDFEGVEGCQQLKQHVKLLSRMTPRRRGVMLTRIFWLVIKRAGWQVLSLDKVEEGHSSLLPPFRFVLRYFNFEPSFKLQ